MLFNLQIFYIFQVIFLLLFFSLIWLWSYDLFVKVCFAAQNVVVLVSDPSHLEENVLDEVFCKCHLDPITSITCFTVFCFIALCRLRIFYKPNICGNFILIKSIGIIFLIDSDDS